VLADYHNVAENLKMSSKSPRKLTINALLGLAGLAIVLWLVLFLPSLSLNYWEAWTYWVVFVVSVTAITAYFLKQDQMLIENRLKTGTMAEKERSQKLIQAFASVDFILLILVPSFDHRFHWSNVPAYLAITGDVFVFLGLLIIFRVFRENSYTSVAIEVGKGQKAVTTGPYGVIRHPMYAGALLMLFFTPLALGSFWGLIFFFPMLAILALRIIVEEKFLSMNLPGYVSYCQKVRYRLFPFIW